ncbi:MAG TPA: hypothetical protein VIC07_10675 [Acidimicrobiia bacterium]|jgi:hypothetical protein
MTSDGIVIRGGAGEFEAAVIAVVLDRIAEEERAAREGLRRRTGLSPWVLAGRPDEPNMPLDIVHPGRP